MKNKQKLKKWILPGLLVTFLIMQFVRIDKTNPPADPSHDFSVVQQAPKEIAGIFKSSCYDCHSNLTEYPWYTNIAPISWWIKGHINNAREHVNFSEWAEISDRERSHNMEECIEMIDKEWMPIGSYARIHADAKLTRPQRDALIAWLEKQL